MVFDSLDGRVARLTHTSSPFGAELDSLSDMVSFGVAPAIIGFNYGLANFGKIGWLVSFVYCACAGLRLAKFNTMIDSADKRFFSGMPSPAAALIVVGYFYLLDYFNISQPIFELIAIFVMAIAGLSMVTNVKFYSFKEFHFHKQAPFRALLVALAILCLLLLYPQLVIYGFFIAYTLISYIMHIFKLGYNKKTHRIEPETEAK